jgi:hypothetical protein
MLLFNIKYMTDKTYKTQEEKNRAIEEHKAVQPKQGQEKDHADRLNELHGSKVENGANN